MGQIVISKTHQIIGLIPAAGKGTRIAPLPGSKELFPVGFFGDLESKRPKVIGQYLLEQMTNASIKQCMIVLGEGKWDIPSYFGSGEDQGIHLAYSVIKKSKGTPFTLDTVYPFISDKIVALGFPDMLFTNHDVYCRLIQHFDTIDCDVLLGLFPADQPHICDMVAIDENGFVEYLDIKPKDSALKYTWGVALWTPKFSDFMHEWLANVDLSKLHTVGARHKHGELFVGDVIQAALESDLKVAAVQVSDHPLLDIGTPKNLIRAIRKHIIEDYTSVEE